MKASSLLLVGFLARGTLAGEIAEPKGAPPGPSHVTAVGRPAIDPGRVHLDAPGDGALWARTERYKARFGPDGARFIPFFGSRAPRNFPLTFTLESITGGGQPLLSAAPAAPVRQGDAAVVYERGAVLERYDLRADSIEQSFVLSALPASGDLVVRMRVESEMQAAPAGPGAVEYVAPGWGRVEVSEAVAFDAAGRRTPVEIASRPGALELRVSGAFLTDASLPVTIDPVVRALPVSITPADDFAADSGSTGAYWMVCYERVYSATDHDVWAECYDREGALVAESGGYIDITGSYWTRPKVAGVSASSKFLVVATRGLPTANDRAVWGRLRLPTSPELQNQFQVAGGTPTSAAWDPDVGGDWVEHAGIPQVFVVVYTGTAIGGPRIEAAFYDYSGFHVGGVIVTPIAPPSRSPAVSKTGGRGPFASRRWNIVWAEDNASGATIRAAQLDRNGVYNQITLATGRLARPRVSPITDDQGDGLRPHLVVWENFRLTGETDLEGAVYDGATRLASANLSALENVARGEDQVNAAVDADGCRFVVAYAESFQGSATDYDVYASTFHYDAGAIGLTERHVILDYASTREDRPAIAAANSLLLRRPRYLAVWDSAVGAANHDVKGAVLDAHAPTGGHASVPTGCGGLTLTATGVPALGIWLNYRIAGSTGFPYLFIGSPMPSLPLCPSCALGVFPGDAILLPGLGSFDVQVPCVPGLIGQSLAFQGASIGMAGGCPAPLTLALTNTIVTTVQ